MSMTKCKLEAAREQRLVALILCQNFRRRDSCIIDMAMPQIYRLHNYMTKISDPNILLLIYEQAVAHVAIAVRIDVNVVDYSITATTRIGGSNNKNEQ